MLGPNQVLRVIIPWEHALRFSGGPLTQLQQAEVRPAGVRPTRTVCCFSYLPDVLTMSRQQLEKKRFIVSEGAHLCAQVYTV